MRNSSYWWNQIKKQNMNNNAFSTIKENGKGSGGGTGTEYHPIVKLVTLNSGDWDTNNEQLVSCQGVTPDNIVFVSPCPPDTTYYTDANVLCTSQGTNELIFTCETLPVSDIKVNVIIFEL